MVGFRVFRPLHSGAQTLACSPRCKTTRAPFPHAAVRGRRATIIGKSAGARIAVVACSQKPSKLRALAPRFRLFVVVMSLTTSVVADLSVLPRFPARFPISGSERDKAITVHTKTRILPVRVENVPQELKARPQWVVWKAVGEKPDKVPYSARDGPKASSTDLMTWSTFEEALGGLRGRGVRRGELRALQCRPVHRHRLPHQSQRGRCTNKAACTKITRSAQSLAGALRATCTTLTQTDS